MQSAKCKVQIGIMRLPIFDHFASFRIWPWLMLVVAALVATFFGEYKSAFWLVFLALVVESWPTARLFVDRTGDRKIFSLMFTGMFSLLIMLCVLTVAAVDDFWNGSAVWQVTALIGAVLIGFPMAMLFAPSTLELVVVRIGNMICKGFIKICVSNTHGSDYLWLPNEDQFLMAQSDEYQWDLSLRDCRKLGFLIEEWVLALGFIPSSRKITLMQDWNWLEPLWREYEVDAEGCTTFPEKLPVGESYEKEFRRFFQSHLHLLKGFPNSEKTYMKFHPENSDFQKFAYQRMLECIPDETSAYKHTRMEASLALSNL